MLLAHPDASARTSSDAGLASARDAATINAGTATLTIGADPWGDIYDRRQTVRPHAAQGPVPAGHHTVEIVFPAESPPRKQTFAVDATAGETKPLQADFH